MHESDDPGAGSVSLTRMSSAASSRPLFASGWLQFPAAIVLVAIALVSAGIEPRALPLVYIAAVTPALWMTDVLSRRLPNRLVLPGFLAVLGGAAGQWVWSGTLPLLAIASGAAYFVFMLALGLAGGMGMGDVKLAGVLGLGAGLLGPAAAILAPVAAFLLGGVAAIAAVRGNRLATIPFGPFMLAGFWIAVVVARQPWTAAG